MSYNNQRTSNGFSFTALLLIILGLVFLLNNFGVLPWEIWSNIWKFWPVLLILFGVEALIGRQTSFGGLGILLFLIFLVPIVLIVNPLTGNPLATKAVDFSKPLDNLTRGRLDFQFQSANVKISALDRASDKLFTGTIKYSDLLPKPTFTEDRRLGEGIYTFTQNSQKSLPFLNSLGNNVNFNLSTLVPMEIKVTSTSGIINLDLSKLKLDLVEIQTTTGQTNITFSSNYSSKVYIKTGAAIVNLTIPKEQASSIKASSTLNSVKIDQTRFPKTAGIYKSLNYDTSAVKLEIEITGQATSVNVN